MKKMAAIGGVLLLATSCAQIEDRFASGGDDASAATADETGVRTVTSIDGSFDGEMIGTPTAGSKFTRVKIGMRQAEVERLIGEPDDTESHITGKQFIPFFFGGDTHRQEAFYKDEGILTYSPQHMGGEPNTLIRIIADPTETGVAR